MTLQSPRRPSSGMLADAREFLRQRAADHVAWRRHLHQRPELGFEERQTAAFITDRLAEMGIEFEAGIAGTGIVATLHGRAPGPVAGLRADMDALPIAEESGVPYRSLHPGNSHACGHDGHMTMLLAAAEYLSARRDFSGTIRFIFQPAEEARGGGRVMVEEGLFERWPVDAVFGLHNWPGLPLGTFAAKAGAVMAAMDLFTITLKGSGVHAALPHLGKDALVAAGALIGSLQTVVSRTLDTMQPAVVSLTQIHGGQSLNALPEEVTLNGTVRALSQESRAIVRASLERIVDGIARAHDVGGRLALEPMYPVTVNDAHWAGVSARIAAGIWGEDHVLTEYLPSMASEDFAFMLEARPGCYGWIGNGRDVPLHNPGFDFNDDLIPLGALYWIGLAHGWSGAGQGE